MTELKSFTFGLAGGIDKEDKSLKDNDKYRFSYIKRFTKYDYKAYKCRIFNNLDYKTAQDASDALMYVIAYGRLSYEDFIHCPCAQIQKELYADYIRGLSFMPIDKNKNQLSEKKFYNFAYGINFNRISNSKLAILYDHICDAIESNLEHPISK